MFWRGTLKYKNSDWRICNCQCHRVRCLCLLYVTNMFSLNLIKSTWNTMSVELDYAAAEVWEEGSRRTEPVPQHIAFIWRKLTDCWHHTCCMLVKALFMTVCSRSDGCLIIYTLPWTLITRNTYQPPFKLTGGEYFILKLYILGEVSLLRCEITSNNPS